MQQQPQLDVETLAKEIHAGHVELAKETDQTPPPFDEQHYRKIAQGLLDGTLTEEQLIDTEKST